MAGLALSLGIVRAEAPPEGEQIAPPPQLSVLELPDGTVEIATDGGVVTISVFGPIEYADTYQVNSAELSAGPVALVPPKISGDTWVGDSLFRQHPGLWVYSGDAPNLSLQWLRNGNPIAGAVASTYEIAEDDVGATLALQETLSDANGIRSSVGDAIVVEPQSAFGVTFTGHGSTDYATGRTILEVPGLPFGGEDPSREILVVVGTLYGPASSLADIVDVTIGGVSASRIVASDPNNGPVEIWRASVPTGLSGDVQVTTSQGCLTVAAALYRLVDARVAATQAAAANGGTSLDISLNTTAGSVVVAGAKSANSGVLSLSGVVENHSGDIRTSDFFVSGHAAVIASEAPRPVGVTTSSPGNIGAVAVVLESV